MLDIFDIFDIFGVFDIWQVLECTFGRVVYPSILLLLRHTGGGAAAFTKQAERVLERIYLHSNIFVLFYE